LSKCSLSVCVHAKCKLEIGNTGFVTQASCDVLGMCRYSYLTAQLHQVPVLL